MKQLPCEGITVIELASVLAGPSVGQFFAELGAEVIKIESAYGDVTRSWKLPSESKDNDRPAYFTSVNWGKTSRQLNLKKIEDREKLYAWVAEAQIVIASYKPGDAKKLGVDYDTLSRYNPQLIYGSITGYGQDDPRVGYDAIIQAEAGFLYMNGSPEGEPVKMPVALMDVLAAHQLKEALLLSLLQLERSGVGGEVSVSLFDAAVSALSNQATNYLNANHLPQRMGSGHPNIVPYGNTFVTQEGDLVLLAVGTDKQFESLCELLGLEIEEQFKTNFMRVKNRELLLPILAEKIANFPSVELLLMLSDKKIPAGRVNNMQQVFEQPQAQQLLWEGEGFRGVKQAVAKGKACQTATSLSAPPHKP